MDELGETETGDRPEGLSDRQRDMLDFERTWWQLDEPRDDAIRARFDCSPDEYYAELSTVLELPGAMDHDPLVVRRFQRRRVRRRRTLTAASQQSNDPRARHGLRQQGTTNE